MTEHEDSHEDEYKKLEKRIAKLERIADTTYLHFTVYDATLMTFSKTDQLLAERVIALSQRLNIIEKENEKLKQEIAMKGLIN